MKRFKLLLAAALLLPLAACFGGAKAPPQLLTLSAAQTRATGQAREASQGHVITVVAPTVPQDAATDRIPVYVDATNVQYLKDALWVGRPNELFRQLLSETLAARTGWTVLDPSVYTQVQGVVLGGQLLHFGLDPNKMEVVVTYEATLARPEKSVVTNRFEARVPVAAAEAQAVAAGLNQAANQVAGEVADWAGH